MIAWWTGLTLGMKILWGISLAASLVFIVQTVMVFIGADADVNGDLSAAADADVLADGGNLYTFRNVVNFLLGFGWSGIILEDGIPNVPLRLFVSILIGVLLVALVMALFKWLSSMQQSGNIQLSAAAAGCKGEVYLPIPASGSGKGKVQLSISGAIREYDALTGGPALATGEMVVVTSVVDSTTVCVEKIS